MSLDCPGTDLEVFALLDWLAPGELETTPRSWSNHSPYYSIHEMPVLLFAKDSGGYHHLSLFLDTYRDLAGSRP
jgi:hypothetical protein